MKITPKYLLEILLICIAAVIKIILSNIFNIIPLFFLKWPALLNVILVVIFFFSSCTYEGHKIDKFLNILSVIKIPLNIVIWVMALISFINGTINCNPVVFYILFGINAILTITDIPSVLSKDKVVKKQEK